MLATLEVIYVDLLALSSFFPTTTIYNCNPTKLYRNAYMNLLATAASIIGAALVGRPLSSDAFKLGVGAAKFSTVDSYLRLERLLTLVSVLTTVGLTLVADTQFHAFGVQAPHSYTAYSSVYIPKATRTTRLPATPSSPIVFADSTNFGLWFAGMVFAIVGGSGTALILCGGQTGQNRSSSGSGREEGDDPGGRRQPYRGGPPQSRLPPPADPAGGSGTRGDGSRSMKSKNMLHKSRSREDPPPPPPPPTTTACEDNGKPDVEQLLLGLIFGVFLGVLAKVVKKFLKSLGKKRKAPKRERKQPARINVSKTATQARALAICVLPVVPLTLLAGCAWNQGPPYAPGNLAPGKLGPIKAGVIVSAATLVTLVLYILFVVARMVFRVLARFYYKMTADYDDFDEDVGDETWTGNDSGDDDDNDDNNDHGGDYNLGSNVNLCPQYDVEDGDHIDDDELGSEFFGEQYDIDDFEFDPERACRPLDVGLDTHVDEEDPVDIGSVSEQDEDGGDDIDDGVSDVQPSESSVGDASVSQHDSPPCTPPRRFAPPSAGNWSYSPEGYAYKRIERRIIMAGDSPTRGGFRNTPPVATHIRISPLKLPGPSRPTLRRQPPLDSAVSKIPVPKVKRPCFRKKPAVDDPFVGTEGLGRLRFNKDASAQKLSVDDSIVEGPSVSASVF